MPINKSALKPSMQRIVDAREAVKVLIADTRLVSAPDNALLVQLKNEKIQLKDLFIHLNLENRVRVSDSYVFNMTDKVLELLRQFLKDELDTMLRGGKNEKNRLYVNCLNEHNIVVSEQQKRAKQVSSKVPVIADAA